MGQMMVIMITIDGEYISNAENADNNNFITITIFKTARVRRK